MRAVGSSPLWRRAWDRLTKGEAPRRLRMWPKRGLVRLGWYYQLRLRNIFSNRVKVGFGPIMSGEQTLGVRKWHIDPIVDAINRSCSRYVGDIFFPGEDLSRFDIVVIAKHFESFTPEILRRLRERRTRLVYDTADMRWVQTADGWRDLFEDPDACERHYRPFLRSMDALILASPLQRQDFGDLEIPQVEIARPFINYRHRTRYVHGGPIRLVWQGYPENLAPMRRLHPIIAQLREETGLDIRLVYDTSEPVREEGPIQYIKWNVHRWEHVLAESDVGVVIKPLDDRFQQRKPPTKVVSYMAAGLPVVCTPSEADRRVITHGKTGFFAYEDHEWRAFLKALVTDASLRQRVGTAARQHIRERYSVERIAGEYLLLFEQLVAPELGGARRPW